MSDRNNNDWYDPKAYRSDRVGPYLPPVPTGRGFLANFLIWILIGGAVFLGIQSYWTPSRQGKTVSRTCPPQPLPASGTTGILDPAVMRRSDVLFSAIEITNNYTRPLTAYLLSPADATHRYAVAHVAPGASVSLSAPVGTYDVSLQHGSHWCGNDKGFSDGENMRLTTPFQNAEGKTGKILIGQSEHAWPSVTYAYSAPELPASALPPALAVAGGGFMELRQGVGGHYVVDGTVAGTPVRFMLDTGATITAVSADFAQRARLYSCRPTTSNTANGTTSACLARVAELSFGHFRMTDVDVLILPQMSGEALLGMNVLRHFGIEQRGGAMRISAP